jgi:hypothetical protein
LFVKMFGFSFTAIRMSTLLVAVATAYLLQRTFVLAGIRGWNATLATIAFVLSPMSLALDFTFMTDISGIFCMVLCLYMCLRALQAKSEPSTIAWISLAALLNALGGTARQTAWLGVLVMVPSTLWLLRRRPRVLFIGGVSCVLGIGFVFASMHWFNQQPYSIPEKLIPDGLNLKSLENVVAMALRGGAELLLLLLPVLLMFLRDLRRVNRNLAATFTVGSLGFALAGVVLYRHHGLDHWLAPFLGNFVTVHGLIDVHSILGERPVVMHDGIRMFLTAVTIVGLLSVLAAFFGRLARLPSLPGRIAAISWRDLGVVLAPFCLAYIALLAPRASGGGFYDRYLLPLMLIALLVLVRFYQERIRLNLPIPSVILIGVFACYGVAATHDLFAMYRGYIAAIEEVRSSGLPATAFSGSWENDGWTELETAGYINEPRIRFPIGAYVFQPVTVYPAGCDGNSLDRIPAVKPVYALSFDPEQCDGQGAFLHVTYRTWLAPHVTSIYIVRLPDKLRR